MKFKSDVSQSIYEIAEGMFKVGVIDEKKFKRLTKDCFVKEPLKPLQTKHETIGSLRIEAAL